MFRSILPPPLPPLVSPGATGIATALVGIMLVGATWSPSSKTDRPVAATASERVRYLLPLLPRHGGAKAAAVTWIPDLSRLGDLGVTGVAARSSSAGTGEDEVKRVRVRAHTRQPAGSLFRPDTETTGGTVYIASQLDRVVERDPGSAGPAYPTALEQERIEGVVSVSYIVDTTGLADSLSMKIGSATHPAFADAVRMALPRMHFHPAELDGRRVRQLVQQEFQFVIRAPVETPHGPIARSVTNSSAGRDSGS